jgi:NAD-dependent SIR2 family protein deacetylase
MSASASTASTSTSALAVETNDLIEKLARLNSNVQLYTQVHSLQQNLNSLEDNYKSLQKDIQTARCNANCKTLNETRDPNSIDEFLIQLLLSKPNSSSASTASATSIGALTPSASAPPLFEQSEEE